MPKKDVAVEDVAAIEAEFIQLKIGGSSARFLIEGGLKSPPFFFIATFVLNEKRIAVCLPVSSL